MKLCHAYADRRFARPEADTLNLDRFHCGQVAALVFLLVGFIATSRAAAQIGADAVKPVAETQSASIVAPTLHSATACDMIHMTVGRSVVLTSASSLRRIYVGNPAVLQTYTSGTNEIVLTARATGVRSA